MLGHRKSSKSSGNQRLRERKWTQAISQAGASQDHRFKTILDYLVQVHKRDRGYSK